MRKDPEKTVQIGARLNADLKKKLISFLQQNTDMFSWSASYMLGIPADVITHELNTNPKHKPVKQKKKNFIIERQKAIDEKVDKLLKA